jgi:hypothetical protein
MNEDAKPNLTMREKVAIHLILLAISFIKPWQYTHEAKEFIKEIKESMS